MKKILLVEDDPVTIALYRRKFEQEGFPVTVAEDGLTAMKELPTVKPDVVILDLMLPRFNGADVLKFIRAHADLKHTKVIIFSNAYMTEIAIAAAKAGADASLLKNNCTPAQLIATVRTILDSSGPVSEKKPEAAAANPDFARPGNLPRPAHPPAATSEGRALQDFLHTGPTLLITICELCQAFLQPGETQAQPLRLKDLHRQVQFFSDHARLAGCQSLAQFAAAFTALLFELQERPENITRSTLRTIEASVDLLVQLYSRVVKSGAASAPPARPLAVLVVDDEPLSNRALTHALSRANAKPTSVTSAAAALDLCQQNQYDLLLLDYLMPEMDGWELYGKLRALPEYRATPVIFVTAAANFKIAHQEIIARGDDIIIKPVMPVELAVKALTLVLRRQLPPA